jgi:hypothetical protein
MSSPALVRNTFAAERATSIREFADTGEPTTSASIHNGVIKPTDLPGKIAAFIGKALA